MPVIAGINSANVVQAANSSVAEIFGGAVATSVEFNSVKKGDETKSPKPPFLARFRKDGKDLYFVAADHAVNINANEDTFKLIDTVINGKTKLVILEGLSSDHGISPSFYLDYAKQVGNEKNEDAYAAFKAAESGASFTGGEIPAGEILQRAKDLGYSQKEIMAFYILRSAPYWRQAGVDETHFDEQAAGYLENGEEFKAIPSKDRLTVAEFKEWYKKNNDMPDRPFLQINAQQMNPSSSPNASYFQRMSEKIETLRGPYLLGQIETALSKYDNVVVVYGYGHFFQSYEALEKKLGKPDFIKVK